MAGGMKNDKNGQSFDVLKRRADDIVQDMKARNLLLPAGLMLVAIVAALIVLPKSASPPPPASGLTSAAQTQTIKGSEIAKLRMISQTTIDSTVVLDSPTDPFDGNEPYECTQIGSGSPKTFRCVSGDLELTVQCPESDETTEGICKGDGASAPTGGASAPTGGSNGSTAPTGGGNTPAEEKPASSSDYVISVSVDGKTMTKVIVGDELPSSKEPLAVYGGTNAKHEEALFIASDGVTVTGVKVDATSGGFSLRKGQTATLTDVNGAQHKMTLKSISKVSG
ncbi:MAG: hypothetical protein ACSLFF_11205 [Solirubrobacterales bacterium]